MLVDANGDDEGSGESGGVEGAGADHEKSSARADFFSTLRSVYAINAPKAMRRSTTRITPNVDGLERGGEEKEETVEDEETESVDRGDDWGGDCGGSNKSSDGMIPEMLSKPTLFCTDGTAEGIVDTFGSSGSGRQSSGHVVRVSTTSHRPLPQRNCS